MRVPLIHIFTAFDVVSVLDFGNSNRCVVLSHFFLNLHFPGAIICGASFCAYLLSVYLCGGIFFKAFGPFFNQVVCFLIVEF